MGEAQDFPSGAPGLIQGELEGSQVCGVGSGDNPVGEGGHADGGDEESADGEVERVGGGGAGDSHEEYGGSEQREGRYVSGDGGGGFRGEASVVPGFVGVPAEGGQGVVSGFWGGAMESGGDGALPG
ncbi:MAG: hypothetical protein RI897_1799 [Verrucomicrobiota bacterium]